MKPTPGRSSSATGPSGPQRIGDLVTDLLAHRGYAQVSAHEECQQAWADLVGSLANQARATEVKRGTLQVIVANSVVLQELTFRKTELLAEMAAALPKHKIRDLRFRIGSLS